MLGKAINIKLTLNHFTSLPDFDTRALLELTSLGHRGWQHVCGSTSSSHIVPKSLHLQRKNNQAHRRSQECTWREKRVKLVRQQVERETACRASAHHDTTTDDLLCANSRRALTALCPTSPDPGAPPPRPCVRGQRSCASRASAVSEASVALPLIPAPLRRLRASTSHSGPVLEAYLVRFTL